MECSAVVRSCCSACRAATEFLGEAPDSVAVDGWGVDFVPVDKHGVPTGPAYAYRDERGAQGRALLARFLDEQDSFSESGVAAQDINSINRIALYGHGEMELPEGTESIMFLQDVVARYLATAEIDSWEPGSDPGPWASVGVASTSGLLSTNHKEWNQKVAQATRIERRYLPDVQPELTEISRRGTTRLIRAGSHDTACAAYAMGVGPGDIFVSCGSWAVVGVITDDALVSDSAFQAGITNEACVDGTNRALLNLTGMWLVQECIRHWNSQGMELSYDLAEELVERAPSLGWVFDPQDEHFNQPGAMPIRIAEVVRNQWPEYGKSTEIDLEDPGTILRLIFESVARRIANGISTLRSESSLSGQIFVAGGAVKHQFFMRLLSEYLNEELVVCSGEATVLGNVKAQVATLHAG